MNPVNLLKLLDKDKNRITMTLEDILKKMTEVNQEIRQLELDHYLLKKETKSLLEDLKRCGIFYASAIEIDLYIDNSIDGEEFEKRIDKLLNELNKKNK
jgi:hypothetical protein